MIGLFGEMEYCPGIKTIYGRRVQCHFALFNNAVLEILGPESGYGVPKAAMPMVALVHDLQNNVTFRAEQDWFAYERAEYWDEDRLMLRPCWTLHRFFYSTHWCACHRLDSLGELEPLVYVDLENECQTGRFLIKEMRHPRFMDVILYRETITQE